MALTLKQFALDLQQQIISEAEAKEHDEFPENVFTGRMIEYLNEAGELEDGDICYYQARGVRLNGYGFSQGGECLDLLVCVYTDTVPPERVSKIDLDQAFRQARTFLQRSLTGYHVKLEESSPVFDAAQTIYHLRAKDRILSCVRLFLLTDGVVRVANIKDEVVEGLPVSHHVWDIERLYRWWSSGSAREKIEIDFTKRECGAIPCLPMPQSNEDYTSYLLMLPGPMLVDIYGEFGSRLLERNVRSFLQVRGDVNKGIRRTVLEEPQMFLAYNNGLTATAEKIEVTKLSSGQYAIKAVTDLQIVNGGQTTASLYYAAKRDKADVSNVSVQMKLSVINDNTKLDDFVAHIARYANSQNKVNVADFSANDPFHRKIEELSRTIWAPVALGAHLQTRWFYERARGQYADARNQERTPAKIRAWDSIHPRAQMFTKTDVAKFENTWMQRPHIVSRGAQKNFSDFTVNLQEHRTDPDTVYFEHLVAKAILFRQTEKIVRSEKFGGYGANIVTYTLSFLSHKTAQCIDLDRIWREQAISSALQKIIGDVAQHIHKFITQPPGGANVTEWCKREKCRDACFELDIALPAAFQHELIPIDRRNGATNRIPGTPVRATDEEAGIICSVPAETWFGISKWAKETKNLQPWQRALAFSLGKIVAEGKVPSQKQAVQGEKILDEAKKLGLRI